MANTQIENLSIRSATRGDLNSLWEISLEMRHAKEAGYFEQQLDFQRENKRLLLIATVEGRDVGYCILNWQPKYGYFKAEDIPEIQDLNVLRDYRQRGIATALIKHCERLATEKGYATMGISFGLYADFGPAQRLYIKMGYVPDGFGVTYDRRSVLPGEFRVVDDQLCLMLTKPLKA